jgi:outer membrane lipoprotein-sorting protein
MITTTFATLILGGFQSTNIDSYLPNGLKDISFNISLTKRLPKELQKIDQSYVVQYSQLDSALFRGKEPFKLRIDVKSDDTSGFTIVNGTRKLISIPVLRIKSKSDVSRQPGQRQTLMDFLTLTNAEAHQFLNAKFVRFDRESGNPVFDLTFPESLNYPVRHRVWLDKSSKYMTKREWYGLQGQLRATFLYLSPTTIEGITVPTVLRVMNAENKIAAESKYLNIKVNDGIADSVFDF